MPEPIDPKADKILKAYQHSKESFTTARTDSEKAMRYAMNQQWSATDKADAIKNKKPYLTYNIILPKLAILLGNEQEFRRRARIKPTSSPSVDIVDIMQRRYNAIDDEQNLEEKLQAAFFDCLIAKMGGWIERSFEINELGYLDFVYRVVNKMNIFLDPETTTLDYELKNSRWIIKESWQPLDIIIDQLEIDESIRTESKIKWWTKLNTVIKRFTDKTYSSNENYDKENNRYKILEMQEKQSRKVYNCWDGTNYLTIPSDIIKKVKKSNPDIQIINNSYEEGIHVTTMLPFFDNHIAKEEDRQNPSKNLDLFPVFSYEFNAQVSEVTAVVDLLLDCQDDVNKALSQQRDYVTQLLSGPLFTSKREKEANKVLNATGNQPNQIIELMDLANNKPYRIAPGHIPPDIPLTADRAKAYAQQIVMITEAFAGESGKSGESGKLFEQKVARASAAVNPFFKNLSKLRKTLAKDFLDNFAYVYAEQDRIIATKTEKGIFDEEMINLSTVGNILNNVQNISARVELDEGEQNMTQKEENFNQLLALTNVISQVNPQYVDVKTLLEAAPIKGAEKMIAHIEAIQKQNAEFAKQQDSIETAKKILENEKIQHEMLIEEEKIRNESKTNTPV